jgi:DNA-binding IclR family transcriptional regulator
VDARISDVGVLDKTMALLGALASGPAPLRELSEATGLARTTAHRLLLAMEVHGLVRRDGEGRFALGFALVALGQAAGTGLPLAAAAAPALARLREETGESVQLYVRQGDRRICVAALDAPRELRTIVPIGASLPLDRGSAGKVLRRDPEVDDRGWAESVAEREVGVASVSAPVRDASGEVVAAVSVSGPIERTSRSPGEHYAVAVERAARAIEAAVAPR